MKSSRFARVVFAGWLPFAGFVAPVCQPALGAEQVSSVKSLPMQNSIFSDAVFGRDSFADAVRNFKPAVRNSKAAKTGFVVVGEVNCPGEYELSGEVNVLTALLAAGGPAGGGSFRRVEVRLHDQLLGRFDLYDYLLNGHIKNDFVFNGGEIVYVPAAGPYVKVSGILKKTGIFEVEPSELFLDRMIRLCGGVDEAVDGYRVEILRSIGSYRRNFLTVEVEPGEKFSAIPLLPGDELILSSRKASLDPVTIEGCVAGRKIQFREGMRLSEVIGDGKTLHSDAALEYGEVLRTGSDKKVYEVIGFSPGAILAGDCSGDFSLRPSDRIVIFSRSFLHQKSLVFVEGLAVSPGKFSFESEITIEKMIKNAGGLVGNAEELSAELARREISNGRLVFTRIEINLAAAMHGDPRHNLVIKPFDSLRIFRR